MQEVKTLKHKKIDQVCLNSYVFYCLWISCVFYCFFIFMYFIVLWFLLFEIFIWINIKLNSWYTKQKEEKIYWFTDQNLKFTLPFVLYTHKKISLFGLTFGRKRSCDCNRRSDFCKPGVKICVRLQRKKSWSGRGGFVCAAKFVEGGAPEAPPPSAVRVNTHNLLIL